VSRLPPALENLLHELTRLPGVGRRGAERLAVHLLEADPEQPAALARALERLRREVHPCVQCGNWAEGERCPICADSQRRGDQLCVVESPSDLWAFEETGAFEGLYHVLGGALSPLGGVTADDLRIDALDRRIAQGAVREVILATNASVEGDATAHYLARRLAPSGVRVTRIAQGVPLGGHLGYADAGTLRLALEGRHPLPGG
jgi:recombination protein RecR